MICLGIDPDSHNLAWALVEKDQTRITVLDLGIITVPKSFKGKRAVTKMIWELQQLPKRFEDLEQPYSLVIEGQEIYRGSNSKVNPNGLLMIAQIAGAAAGLLREGASGLRIPRPREWKQSIPKPVHQARILSKLGWGYKKTQGYSYPLSSPFDFKSSEWKHLVDAIGLAVWGLAS